MSQLISDHVGERNHEKVIIKLGDRSLNCLDLEAQLQKAEIETKVPVAIIGNTRACAIALLALFGYSVEGVRIEYLPDGMDSDSVAVRDNMGHGVSTRLSWPSMLASSIKASKQGKVGVETDLGKVLGISQRGQKQTLYRMLQAYNVGVPFGDCLRISYKTHGKKLDSLLLTPNPAPAILDMLNEGPDKPEFKLLKAQDIKNLSKITDCISLQELIDAITSGNLTQAQILARRCPSTVWEPVVAQAEDTSPKPKPKNK